MSEDRLLETIGRSAREEQKDDARFERLARGDADAELERAAADDPAMAIRLAGSRPLDDATIDRITARTLAVAKKAPAAKVVPVWRRRLVTLAGPLALAAAMLVYVGVQRGPGGPELPEYSVTATGEQAMRGPAQPHERDPARASARLRLSRNARDARDARFELLLRPATAPEGKVVAYAFTFGPGPEPVPLDAKVEIAPDGPVRMSGPSRVLDGVREIRIVVGEPTAIGKFDDAASRAQSGTSDAHVRVLTIPIDRE